MVYAEEKDKVFLNIYKIKTIKTKQNQETSFTFQLCISYYYEIIAFFLMRFQSCTPQRCHFKGNMRLFYYYVYTKLREPFFNTIRGITTCFVKSQTPSFNNGST